ncbi:membrane protein insertion efficiency factor YidD [Helicobacter sp. MIT 05-5294]|uniref:membrane protein insertion efficiency factor YidD n=1 Tax=Helicobacter sp. MIT 05-5294 TaxID=1548150 RepID=UPI0010FD5933|nr:membrane protein insertion efficiency factor YidD [Helicobacter sp. MIT 05-5294]TLD87507.1 membrane protein insertion efficiency factor YidD [Helicobacter sp. MIT 05-5294]
MLKQFCIQVISFYQYVISPSLGATCRYYPSCSEYSKQVFMFQNPLSAFWNTLLRILICNQFFKGGISYPKAKVRIKAHFGFFPDCVKFWLIPDNIQKYHFKSVPVVCQSLQTQSVYIIKNYSKVSCVR